MEEQRARREEEVVKARGVGGSTLEHGDNY